MKYAPALCLAIASHVATGAEPARLPVKSVLLTLKREAEIVSAVEGELQSMQVREGMTVERGQLVARLDDADALLAREHAEISVQLAERESANDSDVVLSRKAVEVARRELVRARQLKKSVPRSVSDSEIDRLELALTRAEQELRQATHRLEVARLSVKLKRNELAVAQRNLERRTIASPINGIVVKVFANQGQWLKPGQQIARVLQIDRLHAEGFVDIEDLPPNLTGRTALLSVDLPGEPQATYKGRVVFVSPEVDPVNGQVRVWAEIRNHDGRLRPGRKVRLQVQLDDKPGGPR